MVIKNNELIKKNKKQMGYLEKLQSVKVGDTVFIKGKYSIPCPQKIISIENDVATLDCNGNNEVAWKFSIKTGDSLIPPTEYWISTEEGNNP